MLGDKDVMAVLAVKDLNRAKKFYSETLGLQQADENPGGVSFKSGNSQLFIYASEENAGTNKATAATWAVDDVAGVVEALKAKGVTFEHYDNLPDTTLEGDIHVMGPAKSAWFKDPDGNILNIVSGM